MSTNKKTRKYDMLKERKNVALLIHDFGDGGEGTEGGHGEGGNPKFSITLKGICKIETGEVAERYRKAHLERNGKYSQFIVGEDIAILAVYVKSARICDINDQVTTW
eukprot:CAMPEP_0113299486 /NCGR_PEP_ID=MMETSP0010_2-20120614/1502_1 /TAXON_ID=216773 ORGANISM="Corethron hystrix, Strain 308" /NCGR_SAMPLE_ID=MMETSP0010_2 /ASSEMBLY_ACC=CAM_ASM_000155 /LENGTH=106 /DNA_ID=CAMNT_0000152731 /DNA_START=200 /DNA_END=517 /DNA_ORIENTATION=- /assembly_acc=CAM_ASM_000155